MGGLKETVKAQVMIGLQKDPKFLEKTEEEQAKIINIVNEEIDKVKGGVLGLLNPKFLKNLKKKLKEAIEDPSG